MVVPVHGLLLCSDGARETGKVFRRERGSLVHIAKGRVNTNVTACAKFRLRTWRCVRTPGSLQLPTFQTFCLFPWLYLSFFVWYHFFYFSQFCLSIAFWIVVFCPFTRSRFSCFLFFNFQFFSAFFLFLFFVFCVFSFCSPVTSAFAVQNGRWGIFRKFWNLVYTSIYRCMRWIHNVQCYAVLLGGFPHVLFPLRLERNLHSLPGSSRVKIPPRSDLPIGLQISNPRTHTRIHFPSMHTFSNTLKPLFTRNSSFPFSLVEASLISRQFPNIYSKWGFFFKDSFPSGKNVIQCQLIR